MTDAPDVGELRPPVRTLMGPGPTDVHPRVQRAMTGSTVGHLDPSFLEVMEEVQELLRYVFRTDSEWTLPISGTGSAAMEAAIANVVEPGDTALVPSNGYFGGRMAEMVRRAGGDPVSVDAPWGEPLDVADVRGACEDHDPEVVCFVHAETSTGVLQPEVPALTEAARDHGAVVVADAVTSLGGVELRTDDWGIDVAYSAGQKCLSAPPGMSPLTVGERAREKIRGREEPVRSWYLDLTELDDYWGDGQYHHTTPISTVYALREALRIAAEEGIENRWERHREVAGTLVDGLDEVGLERYADDAYWLPSLNTVRVPEGVDDEVVIDHLLEEYDLEIASGLGDLSGEVFRIGCMGYSARPKNVRYLLAALEETLDELNAA
ncbi:alanine--glyoxylate aminotransferase [Halobacteriales archaeon QS_5_70_17]|nr:MAG: alanine--glyoxylate aminotransferase [Halobacteriales archaeon QS_5_70_17]